MKKTKLTLGTLNVKSFRPTKAIKGGNLLHTEKYWEISLDIRGCSEYCEP